MKAPRVKWVRGTAAGLALSACLMTGCKSDQEKALDQAKAQAASTHTAQQIQYIDKNGDTVTTTVQPPVSGQAQQVTTTTAPPPPGPKPAETKPVITPMSNAAAMAGPNGAPMGGATTPPPPVTSDTPANTNNGSAAAPTDSGVYPAVAPETAPAPNAAPAPAVNVSVPAGTELAIRINQRINVKYAHAGEAFTGEVAEPIVRQGNVAIPKGTAVRGRIDESHRRGHFKGRSILELRLTSMTLNGNQYEIDTHDTVRTRKGKGKRTAGFIGGMTGAGMIIGGIASGGLGLGVGAAAGAGAGTLLAGATGNRDIIIPAESIVHFRLSDPIYLQ